MSKYILTVSHILSLSIHTSWCVKFVYKLNTSRTRAHSNSIVQNHYFRNRFISKTMFQHLYPASIPYASLVFIICGFIIFVMSRTNMETTINAGWERQSREVCNSLVCPGSTWEWKGDRLKSIIFCHNGTGAKANFKV